MRQPVNRKGNGIIGRYMGIEKNRNDNRNRESKTQDIEETRVNNAR